MTRAFQILLPAAVLLIGVCWFFFSWAQQSPASSERTDAPPPPAPPLGTTTTELPSLSSSPAPAAPFEANRAGAPISPATAPGNGMRPPIAATRNRSSRPGFTTRRSAARLGMATSRDPLVTSSESPSASPNVTPSTDDQNGIASLEAVTASAPPIARGPTYPAVFAHNAAAANAASGNPQSTNAAQASSANPPVTQAEQLMLDKINNDFVTAVGGANQDPNDPAYQLRWDAAQAASDAQYKKFFGGRAYVRRQIEAAQQAAIEQQAAAQP